jgi:ssRNA-specific RNase YbeY (16S rRNA maturation enzyme)
MTLAFVIFLVVHGLIHLMGFAKASGFAELPQLTQSISQYSGCYG